MGTTADKLAYLSATKDTLKASLTGKGVEVPEGTTFRRMAEMVGEISAAGGTVTGELKSSYRYQARSFHYFNADNGRFEGVTLGGSSSNKVSATIKVRKGSTITISGGDSTPVFDGGVIYTEQTNSTEWMCLADGDFSIKING